MRRVTGGGVVTRADVETMAWRVTGWRSEQALVDQLMAAVDAYAALGEAAAGASAGLTSLAETLDDGESDVDGDGWVAEAVPLEPHVSVDAGGDGTLEPVDGVTACCTKCLVTQPVASFARDGKRASGLKTQCRTCVAAQRRRWRAGQSNATPS